MLGFYKCLLLFVIGFTVVQTLSLSHDADREWAGLPRVRARPDSRAAARLPLPTAMELEALRKVLLLLGGQVIPSIIGDAPSNVVATTSAAPAPEVPNDPVHLT